MIMKSALLSKRKVITALVFAAMSQAPFSFGQDSDALKDELAANIDGRAKLVQEMVDSIFSFAEPGFQEFETSAYITGILAENGFEIEMGISGR